MENKWLVCIYDRWTSNPAVAHLPNPIKDEIYQDSGECVAGPEWVCLIGFGNLQCFLRERFREVDMSVGERVCESIERQPIKQLA